LSISSNKRNRVLRAPHNIHLTSAWAKCPYRLRKARRLIDGKQGRTSRFRLRRTQHYRRTILKLGE
jgi:hypothetical protein